MADLTTNIVINARTGNGFSQVGQTLTEMGTIVNGLSQQLIHFGEDSVKVYRDYELSMRDAEVALSTTYGRGTQQLQTVMGQLDTAATEWAATTIFHTNDVANAISEAAHAGWDFDQIMTGIPAAMQLAQAGGLDLSESVNYIVKATNAAGIGFEDLGGFIDLWAFAANSSASTIGEFGDAMLRMGSTMRWAANPEELMTLIAVTANAGAVGSEAGTMIRNSIMRLVAPTDKAKKAFAELGASALEMSEVVGDPELADAYQLLAEHGFQGVYDESGKMRSVLDIYTDMALVLGDMAGGIENIQDNEDAMSIISAIFPTRTVTEALNLMYAAANGWDGLYDSMRNGAAEGYGQYAADTMMDTLNGKIETYESKVERLKQLVGEELKPLVEDATAFAGSLVDSLAEMDPAAFSALVDGLTAVAAAGPALLVAGAAFRLIGLAMTPIGGAALGLTALAAAAAAIKSLSDSRFAENFGTMDLDTEAILGYVSTIGEGFREAYSQVDAYNVAVNTAISNYQTASSTFSGTLLQNMLTKTTLTDADKTALQNLGTQMFTAVQEAIVNSSAASMSYWETLFGGEGSAELDPAYQEIFNLTNQAYLDALAQAEEISQGMRDAMTSAFEDGEISEDEYQQILSYMRSYNDAIARASAEVQSEEDYVARQKMLRRAQTASMEDIQGIYTEARTARDNLLAEREDQFLTEYYRLQYEGASEETLAAADARYQQERESIYASYDPFFRDLSLQVIDMFGGENGPLGEFFKLVTTSGATGLDVNAAWSGLGREDQRAARFLLEQLGDFYNLDSYLGDSPLAGEHSAWRDAYALGQLLYGAPGGQGGGGGGGNGSEVTVYGNTDPLAEAINEEDGQTITTNVTGDPSALEAVLQSYQGRTITVGLNRMALYAEGGRATSASIFGDAGPEWAIPEEHSERTAALLDAARAASGFTWPDLLARYGGLNANANNSPTTLVYSPVINAADARGVDAVLQADKRRFERWFEERRMREAMEVYV